MSWIHIDDIMGAIRYILDKDDHGRGEWRSPRARDQRRFHARLLTGALRPTLLPAPAFDSRSRSARWQRCSKDNGSFRKPRHGYRFRFPELSEALSDVLARKR
jgi:NAD dependent epimerase/dehydratase family enzyme